MKSKQKANGYAITPALDGPESLAGYIAVEANHEEEKKYAKGNWTDYMIWLTQFWREEWKKKFKRIIGKIGDEISDG